MPVSPVDDPYALIAEIYEVEYGRLDADARFFAPRLSGAPVLVVGAGTGRVCRLLSSATGGRVMGLDRSQSMVDLGRRLSPELDLLCADMVDLDAHFPAGHFAEIIAPNAAFGFLVTRADQARFLSAARRLLRPGGSLTLDLPMPVFELWGSAHSPEATAWSGSKSAPSGAEIPLLRTRETHRQPALQRLRLTDRYYVDGVFQVSSVLHLRVVMPAEAEWMLEAMGFWVDEVVGNYAGSPLGPSSERVLVRAVRAN